MWLVEKFKDKMFCNSTTLPNSNTFNHMVSMSWLTDVQELDFKYFNIHDNFTSEEEGDSWEQEQVLAENRDIFDSRWVT